jgi:hypothetical protein
MKYFFFLFQNSGPDVRQKGDTSKPSLLEGNYLVVSKKRLRRPWLLTRFGADKWSNFGEKNNEVILKFTWLKATQILEFFF